MILLITLFFACESKTDKTKVEDENTAAVSTTEIVTVTEESASTTNSKLSTESQPSEKETKASISEKTDSVE